eukprot:scaffold6610_cov245-Pinguiococcus_pyrenoidosus.AAC.2
MEREKSAVRQPRSGAWHAWKQETGNRMHGNEKQETGNWKLRVLEYPCDTVVRINDFTSIPYRPVFKNQQSVLQCRWRQNRPPAAQHVRPARREPPRKGPGAPGQGALLRGRCFRRIRLTLARSRQVYRRPERHEVKQFTIQSLLFGPVDSSFTMGDNSVVVATDTQKNTVYAVARQNEFHSGEELAMLLAKHFVRTYPRLVHQCEITVKEDIWERIDDHHHAFLKKGPMKRWAKATFSKDGTLQLHGGVRQLTVLKTTQSSFEGFVRDRFTLLPEAKDRLLATAIDATWEYCPRFARRHRDWAPTADDILARLVDTFVGPPRTGVPSPSVQATAYEMGCQVVNNVRGVNRITLYLPNIHNIPFNLTPLGMENKDHTGEPDVFIATSEPHGIIQCTIERPRRSRL